MLSYPTINFPRIDPLLALNVGAETRDRIYSIAMESMPLIFVLTPRLGMLTNYTFFALQSWSDRSPAYMILGLASIANPVLAIRVSVAASVAIKIGNAAMNTYNLKLKEAGKSVLSAVYDFTYLAAMVAVNPQITMVSLVAQAVCGFCRSYEFYWNKQGRKPEAAINALVAGLVSVNIFQNRAYIIFSKAVYRNALADLKSGAFKQFNFLKVSMKEVAKTISELMLAIHISKITELQAITDEYESKYGDKKKVFFKHIVHYFDKMLAAVKKYDYYLTNSDYGAFAGVCSTAKHDAKKDLSSSDYKKLKASIDAFTGHLAKHIQ